MYVSQPYKCLYIYMIVVIIIMMIIIIISMRHDLKCVFFHVKTTQFVIILQWYTYIPFNSLTKLFTFYIITYFQTFFRNKSNCVCVCVSGLMIVCCRCWCWHLFSAYEQLFCLYTHTHSHLYINVNVCHGKMYVFKMWYMQVCLSNKCGFLFKVYSS